MTRAHAPRQVGRGELGGLPTKSDRRGLGNVRHGVRAGLHDAGARLLWPHEYHQPRQLPRIFGGIQIRPDPAVFDCLSRLSLYRTQLHHVEKMVINCLSVLVSIFGLDFSPVHTTLVVVSGRFGMFQDVSGSAVSGHELPHRVESNTPVLP